MTKRMKRRDFMRTSAVAGITLAATKNEAAGFPTILKQSAVKTLVIASANGNRFKNGGSVTAVQKAFTMMTGGADVLDSVIRSEEHTSELQSQSNLVCRLLLEKKKKL